jgi:hypothetical protein
MPSDKSAPGVESPSVRGRAPRSLLTAILVMAAFGAFSHQAWAASARRAGTPRTVPQHFFGFNAESIVLPVDDRLFANSAALHRTMASIPVGILRIPGGTTSQWLDWHAGKFIDDPGSPFSAVDPSRPAITMADWARIVRATGATPLWDLNVLTSNLADQMAMLRRARRFGLSVRYVELGNELWDPRGPYPTRFPTGAAYGAAMNPWIRAIKRHFPAAKIAISGADETAPSTLTVLGGARFTTWNASLLSTVRGEDAIAIHPYWGLASQATPGSEVSSTLVAGQDHWRVFSQLTLSKLPAHVPVWLTEWNQTSLLTNGGTQIWAQALSVTAVALEQLAAPRITISLIHDIVGGAANPQDLGTAKVFPLYTDGTNGSKVLARTALGCTVPLLYSTIAGASGVQRLQVRPVPSVVDQPGVTAIAVLGHRAGALLVNLTSQRVTVRLPKPLDQRATFTSLSAPPQSQPGWAPSDTVAIGRRSARGSVTLPPYSVDRLQTTPH